ncbi:MAG: DNA polymerase III subunit chi [Candidatus Dactylopiibacterium sp.]|nr:DNA polymerase III subunit chi [Candidatus Dactylopiibacterium sp.]
MTQVRFYHNAPDRLRAACAITTKAVAQGHRIVVFAPDAATARRYDAQLWTQQAQSFVPHVSIDSALAARTPVVITTRLAGLPHEDMLLNLADDLPDGFERFGQLVEIVAGDEAGVQAARARWRLYKAGNHPVQAFDLAAPRDDS